MDRRSLKLPFTTDSAPDWTCPTCQKAPLRIRPGSFVKEERFASRDHSDDAWEPEWIQYVYCCLLACSNDKCKEVVTSTGTGSVDWTIAEDQEGNSEQVYEDYFRPTFFDPALRLCKIPSNCPESVSKPIEDSFALVFVAPPAASNNVRIAIEALLTELEVPRFRVHSGKRQRINLHQRILLLPATFSHLQDLILAIKWLGNAGSHDGNGPVTLDDVMDLYELMDQVLDDVYVSKVKELKKLAKEINKKKGPVRRKGGVA